MTSNTGATTEVEMMRTFFERRHPYFLAMLPQWNFFQECYEGGRAWFNAENIFKFHKEGDVEFDDRLKRAYRFNHTREVVDLVQKYLFKAPITRKVDDAPEPLKKFWKRATNSGLSIDQFARMASTKASITGRVAVVVDNNLISTVPGEKVSQSDVDKSGSRIYAYVVMPWNILDYAWDEDGDGELLWIKIQEVVRDDADPFKSSGLLRTRVRLWTRTGWKLYQESNSETVVGPGGPPIAASAHDKKVTMIGQGEHKLGFVPVRLFDHILTGDSYNAAGLINDIAYLDRAVANYLSNLDAIIQDQTFSQLAIPVQALPQSDDMFKKVLEMGTKRIFTYDGGAGSTAKPEYLSPDPKQAGVIIMVINKIINEIYHTIGLAGERTKEDNAVGIDNSSGVAKAYDFERVNSLLLAKAQSCQHMENWVANVVCAWAGVGSVEDVVSYPSTFDVARLGDELAIAKELKEIEVPVEVRREQMNVLVDKLFPQISDELKANLRAAITAWDGLPPMAPDAISTKPSTSNVTGSRQGEVTSNTQ